MKKRWGRKGFSGLELSMDYLVELVITGMFVGLFVGGAWSYIDNLADNKFFDKVYLSRDFALALNTVSMSPGHVNYIYHVDGIDYTKFSFMVQSNPRQVAVNTLKEGDLPIYYPYGLNYLFPVEEVSIRAPYKLVIHKDDKSVKVDENE